ncbi:MAG: S41 family peptidase [Candidatus Ryanbacteria bacterium]|nr:S41 family peptidase [Candidatus Ryanbacteria bacterium]
MIGNMGKDRRFFVFITALVIVVGSFGAGTWFGFNERASIERVFGVSNQAPTGDLAEKLKDVDFEPFWKAWEVVERKHISDDPIDRQAMVWGAIKGMVGSLGDPYTVFFPPKDHEDFQSEVKGEFSGIGAEIGIRKETLTVIAPIKESPSARAGLKAGDKILKIDDAFTENLTLDDAIHKIRGERGTKVVLTIGRTGEDKPREIAITRDVIRVPAITTEKKGDVFIIALSSFSENSSGEFQKAVREFLRSGATKIVLDLRNNPGGYLHSSVDIASWWLPEGEVVTREEFRGREATIYRSAGFGALEKVPTVLLVNQGSASASEILGGALQEHKKAILIGERTFGKGSVQELEDITDKTSIKVTIARWTTPSGKSISKEGLAPDIEVKIKPDGDPEKDPQLERALEHLRTAR